MRILRRKGIKFYFVLSLDVTFMKTLQSTLEEELQNCLGTNTHVQRLIPLSGGDVNDVFKMETTEGNYCVKINDDVNATEMFEKEAKGLKELKRSSFRIPKVITTGQFEEYAFLIIEYIESGTPNERFWQTFAENLANLHSISKEHFGLNQNNFIGTLRQTNTSTASWKEFFYKERIKPMVQLGIEQGLLCKSDIEALEKVKCVINTLYGDVTPSLLHGDLWSGNYMVDDKGNPVLIDPAVYYGHPDMDLAMTKLFGGFDNKLYLHYNELRPLGDNLEERIKVSKLYPILVHVNLFGGHYVQQYREMVNRLTV